MRRIGRLPEGSHSSMRSGVVIFDLARVVEELVFNSLEASASQVFVAVGVGSGYVKVTDNGYGIKREELVLLGERYDMDVVLTELLHLELLGEILGLAFSGLRISNQFEHVMKYHEFRMTSPGVPRSFVANAIILRVTSKVDHMAMLGVSTECFDFHGEALSSISHISVLEIVTKARGKPNGYKKIMKDSKCLSLGINDDIQDVGTTVTARDIFYNQPVRRKHLESSPQKVLDSIKMSLLRIALVHVNVSFKVVDVERTAELLHTRPSPSPLPLLFSSFGIAKSVNFYEMNASDGLMKLSGYISGPHEIFSLKAIQYFYINTRFICKGPIHKLLNQLATKFDLTDSWKPTTGSQNDKQIRCHICPTFLLNLKCPRSSYDLFTSERSRSAVEFEDWDLVLSFIENAVKHLWNEKTPHGIPATSEPGRKRCRKVNHQGPLGLSSPHRKKLLKHHEHNPEWEGCISPLGIPPAISHVKHTNKVVTLPNNDYTSESRNVSLAGVRATTNAMNNSYLSPITVFSPERYKFIPHASDMSFTPESGRVSLSKQKCQTSLEFSSPHLKKPSRDYEGIPSWGECFSPLDTPRKKIRVKKHQNKDVLLSDTDRSLTDYRAIKNPQSISCLSPYTVFSPQHHQLIPHTSDELEDGVPSAALVDIIPKFDNRILIKGGVSADFLGFDDGIDINHDQNRSSLRRCSNRRSLVGRIPAVNDEICELRSNARRIAKKWVSSDNNYVDEVGHFLSERDLQSAETPLFQFSPVIKHDREISIEFPIRNSVKSSLVYEDILSVSSKKVDKCSSSQQYLNLGWSPIKEEQCFAIRNRADDTNDINVIEDHPESSEDTIHGYSAWSENEDITQSDIYMKERGQLRDCAFMNFSPFPKDITYRRPKSDESMNGNFGNSLSPIPYKRSSEMDWSPLPYHGEEFPKHGSTSGPYNTSSKKHGYSMGNQKGAMYIEKESSIRSHSAPPFHKGKRKFMDSRDSSTIISAKSNAEIIGRKYPCAEPSNLVHTNLHKETRNMKSPADTYQPCQTERSSIDCSSAKSPNLGRPSEKIMIQNVEPPKDRFIHTEAGVCSDMKETHNSFDPGGKWRSSCSPLPGGSALRNYTCQDTILDITSDILNLSGDTLAPKSIDKNSLDHAKVLSQVDKKFIAVVAGRTLAVIDQHAADERIILEELRPKVLSGEMKTITYLDSEKELVLPEVGYQLLHNYAEQIQAWGWIFNTHSHETSSFTRNLDFLHRQQNVVKLLAVPCILGVNLTDIDLLEFLQQLSDTDGSSSVPPSVHSILNSKACRGAIMFGDKLLPSECSILVEELKRTSLCFQCAHGRPTTVPLVNLDVLHESIARLGSNNKAWHGLPQY